MKTFSLSILLISITFFSKSQTPDVINRFSLEGQLKLDKGISFSVPTIRFRYFHTSNFATRYSINLAKTGNTTYHHEFSDLSGNVGNEKNRAFTSTITFGGEYHLKGTDKFSPYFGADCAIGFGALSKQRTNYDGNNWTVNYTSTNKSNHTVIGMNLVAGGDYYFTQNLFFGVEFGLIWRTTFYHEGVETITIDNQTAVANTPKSSLTSIGNNYSSSFRFGWRF